MIVTISPSPKEIHPFGEIIISCPSNAKAHIFNWLCAVCLCVLHTSAHMDE
jgi:hypothetical protein